MTADDLDQAFEAYLSRDDDAFTGDQFFEMLAEIERRRAQEPVEVGLRVVNGQALSEPTEGARVQGNTLWVGDRQVVVTIVE